MQQRKYNGKEWIEAHGLYEYDSHARMYYPAIMRTTTMDPLAEKYYHISPYAWCGNNLVNAVDLDKRDSKKLKDWVRFGKSVYDATTAVIKFGLQGSAKANVEPFAVDANSNPGSFDLVGIRDGKFTPNKNAPTVQSGGKFHIDNAPVYHSKAFQAKIDEWGEQDLYLYFLLPYSPELNKIETLW